MVMPLALTLMMTIVFGNLFNTKVGDYAPYVLSGLVVWDFIVGSVLGGCNSILVSEGYVKQFRHPIAIYPLRTTLVNISTFLIAFISLFIWLIFSHPQYLLFGMLSLPLTVLCLAFLGFPIAVTTSFIHIKYRDFGQVMTLVMQLLWYMSPVFFKREMFSSPKLGLIIQFNPISHVLDLIRQPFLYGQWPSLINYAVVLGTALLFYLIAFIKIRREESSLIFYF
jgi:lipopolysaccharide transport system permease protein